MLNENSFINFLKLRTETKKIRHISSVKQNVGASAVKESFAISF